MGRLSMFNLVSLDGFFAGPGGEIDWFQTDDEFEQFAIEHTGQAQHLLFGRVTYELMASYWPTEEAAASEPEIARLMNTLPKTVFSRTLHEVTWENARLARDGAADEVARLKRETDGDIFLFGSADLAATLTAAGLLDEYRLIVNPVVLGRGKPLFRGDRRLDLRLTGERRFGNGNLLLTYEPTEKADEGRIAGHRAA
ncbi:MAG TPA: dihydrofolate reductase family protein [Thermoleophilia bacterium]|nr:dihydrofolate reductase family protein [Thermoleophilia bacterium]